MQRPACTLYWPFCKPAPCIGQACRFIVFAANRVKKWNVWPIHILKMNFKKNQFQNVLKRTSLEKRGHFHWVGANFLEIETSFRFETASNFSFVETARFAFGQFNRGYIVGNTSVYDFEKLFKTKKARQSNKRNQQVSPGWPRSDTLRIRRMVISPPTFKFS